MTTEGPTAAPPGVRLRSVALPNEHGVWGFYLESALLGLPLAPSGAGALVALGALAAVVAQHPLSLVLADARRGRAYPRTALARRVLATYALAAAVLVGGGATVGGIAALLPLVLAAPIALVQLRYDRAHRGRELVPELAGAAAMPAIAAGVALAGGAPPGLAALVWLALLARNVPSVLYVRARLRLERGAAGGRAAGTPAAVGAAVVALAAAAAATAGGVVGASAVIAYGGLLGRAALGLSRWRRPVPAKTIGITEMVYGGLVVIVLAQALR
jgi:hypothetical protein